MESLCLKCVHYSGKPKYVAKTSNGISVVESAVSNKCLKHNVDLPIIEKELFYVPDIVECESFEKK